MKGAKKNQMVSKPIITVTEFTPGNTPDKVRRHGERLKQVKARGEKSHGRKIGRSFESDRK